VEHGHFFIRGTKGGKDDDIPILDGGKVLSKGIVLGGCFFNQIDLHFRQSIIDFGIVNEFIGNMKGLSGIMFDRFIGQGDTTFDSPTETKILEREEEGG